jgi:hypothetical protein
MRITWYCEPRPTGFLLSGSVQLDSGEELEVAEYIEFSADMAPDAKYRIARQLESMLRDVHATSSDGPDEREG